MPAKTQSITPPKGAHKRGAVRKESSHFIGLWIPEETVAAIDRAVITLDTDRSKFIRKAIRNAVGQYQRPA